MKKVILTIFCLAVGITNSFAQSTEFSFQGRLLDSSLPANASYDFEFRLFAVESGGSAIGTVSRPGVTASSGLFTVKLDFGASFDGTPRWLEITVKPGGSGAPFTTLAPRQTISSAPYAIRSLNSAAADTATNSLQLGGVAANQYVITSDPRMSDARVPTAGSADYIQNTAVQQVSSNFNVSGNGTLGGTLSANAITSATQFNIGVNRALALGTSSIFAGRLAGVTNTTGSGNSFFGDSAGRFNTTASNNSFFGRDAGVLNTAGDNSFFGAFAGDSNTTGTRNSFFGRSAGTANVGGADNSFFGFSAGVANAGGSSNTFVGHSAGSANTGGSSNTFVGNTAGSTNTTGTSNTLIGAGANVSSPNLSFAAAIGAGVVVTENNTVVIGRTLDSVRVPGGLYANYVQAVGVGARVSSLNVDTDAHVFGTLKVDNILPNAQSFAELCALRVDFPNTDHRIGFCSSQTAKNLTNIANYAPGLEVVRRLRPIIFTLKDSGQKDIGFAANEVENVEPLLAFRSQDGKFEGIKYKQITTVLVNAVNEQQQIIEMQQKRIDALMRLMCRSNPDAEECKQNGERP